MDWNKDKSVLLSQVCIVVFAFLLAAADIGAYWLLSWFMGISHALDGLKDGYFLLLTFYSCSVFAWIMLVNLWKLLTNIRHGRLFESSSVRCLRKTAWCCAGVCAICLLSSLYYIPLILISISAGFVALIVRIVKNVFEQAIWMKNELDFTI